MSLLLDEFLTEWVEEDVDQFVATLPLFEAYASALEFGPMEIASTGRPNF